ncbi:MAG: exosortase/archaeosortase family protein [Methylacidiphilales bacterium]|nr:exosortase/archaeosortase family protein [Candidatus Methylacidiphilales bacterium]
MSGFFHSRLRHRSVPVLLALLWLMLVKQLSADWTLNPQYSYGWLMPFLSGYLLWLRWMSRPPPDRPAQFPAWTGWIVAFCLLPIRLLQEANPDWRLVSWALALVVLAITVWMIYLSGGRSWVRHFIFPFAFMLLSVPWPTGLETALEQNLMRGVAGVTVEVMNWLGVWAVQQGNLIHLSQGVIGINEACSGIRSLQSTLMASLFVGEFYQLRPARRGGLLAFGLVCAVVFNLLRALFLTGLCVLRGQAALASWHDPAGLLILSLSFAVLLLVAARLRTAPEPRDPQPRIKIPSVSLPPFRAAVVLLVWIFLVEVLTEGWYRLHEHPQPHLAEWKLEWPPKGASYEKREIPSEIKSILRYDEGWQGVMKRPDGSTWNVFSFRWNPGKGAETLARSHSPEICLPAAGGTLLESAGEEVLDLTGLRLPLRMYTFRWNGRILHVFYVLSEQRDVKGLREWPSVDGSRFRRFEAVIEGKRQLGQQVLEIVVTGYPDLGQARLEVERYLRQSIKESRH